MAKTKWNEVFCDEQDCTNNARATFNGKDYCDRHALYIFQDIAKEHGEGINIGELIESLESIAETIDNGEVQTGLEMMNNVMMSLAIQNAAQQNVQRTGE